LPVQAIEQQRLYRQIAAQLEQLIEAGEFRPGARLPAERELAKRMGVSRPSVREAMIALELAGLVEIRTGSGVYVCEAAPRRAAAGPGSVDRGPGPFELIRARKLIEAETAALAATERSEAQLAAIEDSIGLMRREIGEGTMSEDGDRLFHIRVAEAAQNSVLAHLVEAMWDWGRGEMWRAIARIAPQTVLRPTSLEQHGRILAAIRAGDAEKARAAMLEHLDTVESFFLTEGETPRARRPKKAAGA
jgi:DNA-binding FadR family transcriptional regulator